MYISKYPWFHSLAILKCLIYVHTADHTFATRSATNMRWIEEKMKLLGCDKNPNYNLSFYLDSRAMISIQTEKYGIVDVKPLGVIWGKYPQYDRWEWRNPHHLGHPDDHLYMIPTSGPPPPPGPPPSCSTT